MVSAAPTNVEALLALAAAHDVPAVILGRVTEAQGARFRLGPGGSLVDLPLAALIDAYESGLPDALAGTPVAADVHGA